MSLTIQDIRGLMGTLRQEDIGQTLDIPRLRQDYFDSLDNYPQIIETWFSENQSMIEDVRREIIRITRETLNQILDIIMEMETIHTRERHNINQHFDREDLMQFIKTRSQEIVNKDMKKRAKKKMYTLLIVNAILCPLLPHMVAMIGPCLSSIFNTLIVGTVMGGLNSAIMNENILEGMLHGAFFSILEFNINGILSSCMDDKFLRKLATKAIMGGSQTYVQDGSVEDILESMVKGTAITMVTGGVSNGEYNPIGDFTEKISTNLVNGDKFWDAVAKGSISGCSNYADNKYLRNFDSRIKKIKDERTKPKISPVYDSYFDAKLKMPSLEDFDMSKTEPKVPDVEDLQKFIRPHNKPNMPENIQDINYHRSMLVSAATDSYNFDDKSFPQNYRTNQRYERVGGYDLSIGSCIPPMDEYYGGVLWEAITEVPSLIFSKLRLYSISTSICKLFLSAETFTFIHDPEMMILPGYENMRKDYYDQLKNYKEDTYDYFNEKTTFTNDNFNNGQKAYGNIASLAGGYMGVVGLGLDLMSKNMPTLDTNKYYTKDLSK